jgi:radical SAM family uncharacterized protein/radical SAM-linked protein
MSDSTIQDMLPLVQMPSRYMGSEVNRIKKKWDENQLHVALAFPDLYEIATSHFGIQILYDMLNDSEGTLAERVFAPAPDLEKLLREKRRPLCSLESEIPLNQFDIVGFSLLYELNYTNMVNMLDLGGIALMSKQREEKDPFIIAGGPCTCNPEPVADFFDAIVVGDGEAVILEMTAAWKSWQQDNRRQRKALLRQWSRIKGVYIPSFFDVVESDDTHQRLIPQEDSYRHVERAVIADLNDAPFPSKPIIPFGKPIHDRLRMEIARGCTRGCRFCQAGMIYRPVRERQPDKVLASIGRALKQTGYEDLSLLSLSTGDYSCIAPLMNNIMEFGKDDRLAVSLPSLRAGSLTPELMELIKKVRKTGFTIAPEAGSQRLRDVINKNISEKDIVETVENAFALGWKLIKLYFMIGLPTETQADVDAIVDLVKRLKKIAKAASSGARINVSVATFVPKPHTPFQWEPQHTLDQALGKINWLKANLKMPGVQVKWQDPRVSVIEGIWARGDRKLNQVLIQAWKRGCRFDGWTDYFDYDRWISVFEEGGLDTSIFTRGPFDLGGVLPWDHIKIGVEKGYLIEERKRAIDGKITADCRTGSCSNCGVCDFDRLRPISFHNHDMAPVEPSSQMQTKPAEDAISYLIDFKKMGKARFLGHLEMVKVFTRSLRRARIPLKYSNGFHPMPKVSFGDTLPMGMQSENEQMRIILTQGMEAQDIVGRIQPHLPMGLELTNCAHLDNHRQKKPVRSQSYLVELKDGFFNGNDLEWFLNQQIVNIERKNKKGKTVVVDLKKAVDDIELIDNRRIRMSLGRDNNMLVRPAQVLNSVFELTEQQILTAIITKQKTNHV